MGQVSWALSGLIAIARHLQSSGSHVCMALNDAEM